MNEICKFIKDNIVTPSVREISNTAVGVVIAYDNDTNRACIDYKDPFTDGMVRVYDVPLQIGSGGVHSAGPFNGDGVIIQFEGGNKSKPRVIALLEDDYLNSIREGRTKHERKGAYMPDMICERSDI